MAGNFRNDVNGLRAIAVALVVLFHFDIRGFSGGFVGVDIFFVISGFLMASIVVRDLESGRTAVLESVWTFYRARVNRIVPALLVLVIVLSAVGWFFLSSFDYEIFAKHALSAVTFSSNIILWLESGYFDTASHDKWLLHTWSLSVEWQFYILFPIVLHIIWRLRPGRRTIAVAVTAGLAISLALSIIFSEQSPSASFFLLPTRAWEMLAGSFVFLYFGQCSLNSSLRKILELSGIGLIALSVAIFDASSQWPGYNALIPVAGSALVLIAARDSLWSRLGATKLIGLTSYSLYLWHWPVVVAFVYFDALDSGVAVIAGICVSVALGLMSYHYVENPSRRRLSSGKRARVALLVATLCSFVVSAGLLLTSGAPSRLPAKVESIAQESENYNPRTNECLYVGDGIEFRWCRFGTGPARAVVVGDSHAMALVSSIQKALQETLGAGSILLGANSGCPTVFGVERVGRSCSAFNNFTTQRLAEIPSSIPLFIVNRSSYYVFGETQDSGSSHVPLVSFNDKPTVASQEFLQNYLAAMTSTVCTFSSERHVFLVRPIPEMPTDVPRWLSRRLLLGQEEDISISRETYDDRHSFVWAAQDAAAERCGAYVLDPTDALCDNGQCYGSVDSMPLYYDDDHLSEYGNRLLVPMFKSAWQINQAGL
jgi:peptidoglycan/LPS O-acetylase OafA/YrhL